MFGGAREGHARRPAAMLEEAGGRGRHVGEVGSEEKVAGRLPLLPGPLTGLGRRPSPHASSFPGLPSSATSSGRDGWGPGTLPAHRARASLAARRSPAMSLPLPRGLAAS